MRSCAGSVTTGPACPAKYGLEPQGDILLQTSNSNAANAVRKAVLGSTSDLQLNAAPQERGDDAMEPTLETFPWRESIRKLHQLTPRSGVSETIWSNGKDQTKCGNPCVAHCLAGQPRDFTAPGLRKALKHRLFDKFSSDPVIFGVFVTSGYHNSGNAQQADGVKDGLSGYARTPTIDMANESMASLVSALDDIGVSRALFLNETCQDPSCMENPALQCNAADLHLKAQYDQRDGKVHHICDVQFRRFQTCMNLVREYELEHGMTFDWVARSRPDVYWTKPGPHVSELETHVYVTPWNIAYGAMDWFFALPREYADVFARFPEEASCSQLQQPKILEDCAPALGCECWMASWLYKNNVKFERLPKASHIVAKFCGNDACPRDWNVNETTIEER